MNSLKQWQFQEKVTANVSNGLRDIFMVIPIMYDGTHFKNETTTVVLSTDADWATCRETRRSNSGGTVMLGDHLIAAWSRVQPRIALSSGEAALYAGLRGNL